MWEKEALARLSDLKLMALFGKKNNVHQVGMAYLTKRDLLHEMCSRELIDWKGYQRIIRLKNYRDFNQR